MSNVPDVKLCDSFIILICTTKSLCIFIIIYLFNFGKFLKKHNLYLDVFVGQLWSNIKSSKPSIVFYFYSNDNIYKTTSLTTSLTLSHSNIKIV